MQPPPVIRPMLAESIDANLLPELVFNDDFYFEQKLDGHRILLRYSDFELTALERRGEVSQHNQKFQTLAWTKPVIKAFGDATVFFDCEFIDGELFMFDLPYFSKIVNIDTVYQERRYVLDYEMAKLDLPTLHVVPCAKEQHKKALLAASCIKNNAEGVMVKHRHGTYASGKRSKQILKAKFTKTADLVVTALNFKGKDNAVLSAYNEAGKLIEVGRCSTIGKPKCNVGDVVEVRYLYQGSNGRLVQPTMLCVRTDKTPRECFTAQLIPTSKEVLFHVA